MSNIILEAPDISCAHCERTVTNTLKKQAGVNGVQVDIPQKLVHLDFDPQAFNLAEATAALDEAGYPVAATHEGAAPSRGKFIPLNAK